MKYSKEESERLLSKVEQMANQKPEFSESEVQALHEMLNAWRGWVSLGRGAKWVITVLGLVAAAIASWSVVTKAFKEWIGS